MEMAHGYGAVGFSYSNPVEEEVVCEKEAELTKKKLEEQKDIKEETKVKKEVVSPDDPYVCPWKVPEGILTPATRKLYLIMEHTAKFLCEHGDEAAKVLKAQQSDNINFLFLSEGHPLYQFFVLMKKRLKEGLTFILCYFGIRLHYQFALFLQRTR